jgi:hypothetical protein
MAGGLYVLSTSLSQEVATIMRMYLVVPLWLVGYILSTSLSQEVATIMRMYLVVPLWLVGYMFSLPAS